MLLTKVFNGVTQHLDSWTLVFPLTCHLSPSWRFVDALFALFFIVLQGWHRSFLIIGRSQLLGLSFGDLLSLQRSLIDVIVNELLGNAIWRLLIQSLLSLLRVTCVTHTNFLGLTLLILLIDILVEVEQVFGLGVEGYLTFKVLLQVLLLL